MCKKFFHKYIHYFTIKRFSLVIVVLIDIKLGTGKKNNSINKYKQSFPVWALN